MKRNVEALAEKEYDLLIVGGGIYGASVARDAALRGLAVALVDKGDFGSATSANGHKIIHGGLRYLQNGNLKRMRESIRERSILMRIAPHLVRPLPFLVPTYRNLLQSTWVMWVALKLNDLISVDRNGGLPPQQIIPPGRIISRQECLRLCPGLDHPDLTGGALFFDGQALNTDRLTLSVLLSAARAGADLVNYAQVIHLLREGDTVTGVRVKDVLAGDLLDARARIVANCSGPWIDDVFQLLESVSLRNRTKWWKAAVLVARPIVGNVAIAVPCKWPSPNGDALINNGYRYLFVTPWRNRSLIGTFQSPCGSGPDDFQVTEKDIHDFIQTVNNAYPAAAVKRQDVCFIYGGLVPASPTESNRGKAQLLKRFRIYDHEVEDGIRGLVSVTGVKYTTARGVAEKTVDLILRKLGKGMARCRTALTPVCGGAMESFAEFLAQEVRRKPTGLSQETLRHLIERYGSEYPEVLRYCDQDPQLWEAVYSGSPVIRAEVLHAVREEMAQKLTDVIFRRTGIGTAGYPGSTCLERCAAVMAKELGWDDQRTQRELEEATTVYDAMGCMPWSAAKSLDAY